VAGRSLSGTGPAPDAGRGFCRARLIGLDHGHDDTLESTMRKWHGNPWAVLLTLSTGFLMTLLDLTIVNIAIPSMIDQLEASLDEVLWVINGYVLVLALLLITFGRLGDLRGQRNVFIAGVAIFTVASLACGLAQDPAQLIAARLLQGLGAAALMPQTMAIIIATFPPDRRGTALGVWGAVAGLATVIGPTLGGLLITVLDWRWIFFVNLPIGVGVLVAAVLFIPDVDLERRHKLDWAGVGVATAALFCFTFALTEGQRYEWRPWIWALLATGLVLVGVFVAYQARRQDDEPLVPFALFRDRNFTIMNFVGAVVSVGIIGSLIPITIYLQSVLGYSALKAGLVLAPSSVVSMVVAPFAGRFADRVGGKYILVGGLSLFATGTAWFAVVEDVEVGWSRFMAPLAVMGVGMGCIFAPMATEAMRGVPPRLAGAAAGVNTTIRQVGSVIGSAAMGALLQHQLVTTLREEAAARAGQVPAAYRDQFVAGFDQAAKGGVEVGAGQTGAAQQFPSGMPEAVVAQLQRLGAEVFQHAFVRTLHPTLLLPVIVICAAAIACLAMTRHHPPRRPAPEASAVETATA
jgi:EmrB/QacA subfamily drug resistance transporter